MINSIFHVAVCLLSNRQQETSKCGKNIGQLLQVPVQKLCKTKETEYRKQNNSKERLIPSDQKHNAFRLNLKVDMTLYSEKCYETKLHPK